jgi:hypothetical protein
MTIRKRVLPVLTIFRPSLHNDNTFTSPGKFCPQSKNLIPLGCTISGVDESGCLP